jgi:glutamate-5-semialdehyde dehydrogenase
MPQFVDVIIPRGGKGLIERISRDARVPVIKHLDGNCHVYVDDPGDLAHGAQGRPTTPRHRSTARAMPPKACWWPAVWPRRFCRAWRAIFAAKGVEMRACPRPWPFLQRHSPAACCA